jgi:hypothetical protein
VWGQKVKVRERELNRNTNTAGLVQSEQEETQRREGRTEKSNETEKTKGSEEERNGEEDFVRDIRRLEMKQQRKAKEEQENAKLSQCLITPEHHAVRAWRLMVNVTLWPFYPLPQEGPAFPDKS